MQTEKGVAWKAQVRGLVWDWRGVAEGHSHLNSQNNGIMDPVLSRVNCFVEKHKATWVFNNDSIALTLQSAHL